MITFALKVIETRYETPDSVTVCFAQPGLKKIKYLAGQYLTLIFRINERRYIRPYSFSSAPGVDPHLEVTIKRVPGGIVSNHIVDKVKVGDVIQVMPPMGEFCYDPEKFPDTENVVLWGVGSGITPLISLAKYLLALNQGHCVTLVYGNRNLESVIFLNKINELKRLFPLRFSTWHFHTHLEIDKESENLFQGRINPSKVLSIITKTGHIYNSLHFICGPLGLKQSVKKALSENGVKEYMIFTEEFEKVKNQQDFVDVSTRFVEIIEQQQSYKVEVVKGKSILEAGLDASVELPYSCQTGNCAVCKGRLIRGSVKVIGVEHFPDNMADDEYLLCCTYPLTDDVTMVV